MAHGAVKDGGPVDKTFPKLKVLHDLAGIAFLSYGRGNLYGKTPTRNTKVGETCLQRIEVDWLGSKGTNPPFFPPLMLTTNKKGPAYPAYALYTSQDIRG